MHELQNEVIRLREALAPFAKIAEIFNADGLKNARASWSDIQGDQDEVVLLVDRHGRDLLVLKDFLHACDVYNEFSKQMPL